SRRQAGRRTARLVSAPPRHLQATPHHRVPFRPPPSGERQTRPSPPPGPPLVRSAAPHLARAEAGMRLGRKGASGAVVASGAGGEPVECLEDLRGAPKTTKAPARRRATPAPGTGAGGSAPAAPTPAAPGSPAARRARTPHEQQVFGSRKGLSCPSWSTFVRPERARERAEVPATSTYT